MNYCKNEHGSILLNVVAALMALFMISFFMTGLALQEYRLISDQAEREKAYYTAVSAVRLMAEAVMEEKDESLLYEEEGKISAVLEFQADHLEVSIPVTVWTKTKEDKLVLYAKAGSGRAVQTVFLVMNYENGWFPLTYGFRQGSSK